MNMKKYAALFAFAAFLTMFSTGGTANAAPAPAHGQTLAEVQEAIAKELRASTPVTEQLHDSLPATTNAVTYIWSTVRYMTFLNPQGVWTGFSTGYRVLGEHDSTYNRRRISRLQFTGNACPDPNAYVDGMSFASHQNGPTGPVVGSETKWNAPSPTSSAYCNWDYFFSVAQNGWLNNAFTGTWTIHISTNDPHVTASTGSQPSESQDQHSF